VRAVSPTTEPGRDAGAWAREAVARGAGEVLLTSIDRDGTRSGYDLALTAAVSQAVSVPVIASGGAGGADDIGRVLTDGGASAALLAGILHTGRTTVTELKRTLRERGIAVRDASVRPTPAEVASWLG
jgi:cyclase